ncbi:TetR family transcriptional regulator [Micromonospora echinospora]|uniref:Transcriptional regulator, TetR family n=1 Tax=Micromonospora echinospora TaxID=1877 RepID=A0A1C4ZKK4_MICEC|nr:TetR/AcrR family transcriptional regulator [Micromonospora echinospora]OZV81506.1 TetR family transcriptional regulator [Micromonospora echinospora]SCF33445.1 transcriptional regulator, TetR family [Micromonospora echinospora]
MRPAASDTGPVATKRPKDRKDRIALAGAELFCERGYHRVSVDEIAAVVGISGPAVYRHFPNKYAILVHATREVVGVLLAATAAPQSSTTEGVLDELLNAVAGVTVSKRRVAGLYQWEGRYLTPEHRREFAVTLATLVGRLAGPLRALRPELTAGQAELLVEAALSAFGSVATYRAAATGTGTEQLLNRVAWTLLRADAPQLPPPQRATPGTAPVRPASRRELLLIEAIRLFHRHGYHAVAVEDIGRAAGMQASSVYRYFPGKADLLAAAYYRATELLTGATSAAIAEASDPADALRRVVQAYVAYAFGQSDLVAVYLAENNNLPDKDRHQLRGAQRRHVEEWVRLVNAVRPDLPVADARVLVHAALNVVTDMGRLGRFDRTEGYDAQTARLALAVLHA